MSSNNTALFVESPKSVPIFGFEPISPSAPCGPQLLRRRSLLAELLQATTLEANDAADEDNEHCSMPVPTLRPAYCTCNVGHVVPREFHARECALATESVSSLIASSDSFDDGSVSSPIAIPTKTYYKTSKQIDERQRLQYQRQVYRIQQEAQEQMTGRKA